MQNINPDEHIAREWAERHKYREKVTGCALDDDVKAVVNYILATTEPSKPPTMADVEWDHDTHFLAEAKLNNGLKVAMIGMVGGYLHGIVTDLKSYAYEAGQYVTDWNPEYFTPTGHKYKLVPVEPEPLPEPEDCKPGDHYLVRLYSGDVVAAERRVPGAEYPWAVPGYRYKDEEVTILAHLTPDREVPNV